MKRAYSAIFGVISVLFLTSCADGGEDSGVEPDSPRPSQLPTALPLLGDVQPKEFEQLSSAVDVLPASGYVPEWAVKGDKIGRLRCAPGFVSVPLTINSGVEYRGSRIGIAIYSVEEDFREDVVRDLYVSSSDEMPDGIIVVSKSEDYDVAPVYQAVDLYQVVTGSRIVHIVGSALKGTSDQFQLSGVNACFARR